jgi:hypothetical protein
MLSNKFVTQPTPVTSEEQRLQLHFPCRSTIHPYVEKEVASRWQDLIGPVHTRLANFNLCVLRGAYMACTQAVCEL